MVFNHGYSKKVGRPAFKSSSPRDNNENDMKMVVKWSKIYRTHILFGCNNIFSSLHLFFAVLKNKSTYSSVHTELMPTTVAAAAAPSPSPSSFKLLSFYFDFDLAIYLTYFSMVFFIWFLVYGIRTHTEYIVECLNICIYTYMCGYMRENSLEWLMEKLKLWLHLNCWDLRGWAFDFYGVQ